MTTTSSATVDLSELADRHEIETLVHRVGLALDEGRFDDLRAIYTATRSSGRPAASARASTPSSPRRPATTCPTTPSNTSSPAC